jgi:uncharacterized protein (DUF39 family)
VAVNLSDDIIYTYMGILKPHLGNANYCGTGQLSPLLNDPYYRTIGIGSRIFLAGAQGYIVWQGTQHNPAVDRIKNDIPKESAGTLATIGNLKDMSSEFLLGTSILGYGVSLTVGIGIPIPILDEDVCRHAAVKDEEIITKVVDYSKDYPAGRKRSLKEVNYAELKSGKIKVKNKEVVTSGLSSYAKAKRIATLLKESIKKGEFTLTEPQASLPCKKEKIDFKPLKERPFK